MSHKPEILFSERDKFDGFLDRFLIEIHKIIVWQNPSTSIFCIVVVNIIFWLICLYNFKFYGIFFTLILIFTFESLWSEVLSKIIFKKFISSGSSDIKSTVETSYPETEENLTSRNAIKKSQAVIKNGIKKAVQLRQINPAGFCIFICICFLLLSIAGKYLSGITWLYALIMLILTVPGIALHFLPKYMYNNLGNFCFIKKRESTDNTDFIVSDDDDCGINAFLPEITQEVLELLNFPNDVQYVDKSDFEDSTNLFLKCTEVEAGNNGESIGNQLLFCSDESGLPLLHHDIEFLEYDPLVEKTCKNENFKCTNYINKEFDSNSLDDKLACNLKFLEKKKDAKMPKNKSKSNESYLNTSKKKYKKRKLIGNPKKLKKIIKYDEEVSSDIDGFEIILEDM